MNAAISTRSNDFYIFAFLLMITACSVVLGNTAQDEALFDAATEGNLQAVNQLLAEGANPEAVIKKRSSPRTPVTAAIAGGHLAIVQVLVAAGVDPDTSRITEGSPLINAARYGQPHIAAWLLEAGADPDNTVAVDGSPLINAARFGHADIVALLLEAGADPNLQVKGDGSPLINAAKNGDASIVRLLLAHGAEVNQYVRFDDTPLITAVRAGHGEVAALLIAEGADVNQTGDRDGFIKRTPLRMARKDHPAIADMLEQAGATR